MCIRDRGYTVLGVGLRNLRLFRRGNLVLPILENGTERSDGRRRSECQQPLAGIFQPCCTIAVCQPCHTGTGLVALLGFFAACEEISDNRSGMFTNRAAPGCELAFVVIQILPMFRRHMFRLYHRIAKYRSVPCMHRDVYKRQLFGVPLGTDQAGSTFGGRDFHGLSRAGHRNPA